MSDMRSSLWSLDRSKSHFKIQDAKNKRKFFKLLVPGKDEQRLDLLTQLHKGGFMHEIGFGNTKQLQQRRELLER